jgi:hypothetical protein
MLGIVAEHLGDALRAQLVFVGGAVAGLLVTDPASPSIRPTEDVDLVCSALALACRSRSKPRSVWCCPANRRFAS